jgi:hypothetical protein
MLEKMSLNHTDTADIDKNIAFNTRNIESIVRGMPDGKQDDYWEIGARPPQMTTIGRCGAAVHSILTAKFDILERVCVALLMG